VLASELVNYYYNLLVMHDFQFKVFKFTIISHMSQLFNINNRPIKSHCAIRKAVESGNQNK